MRAVSALLPQPALEVDRSALPAADYANLGEALSALPGVHTSSFGPAVGRPVIRGYSGKRVEMVGDGLAMGDASAAGPDHAVALDPRLIRKVTIVRGPASLLYGGSAVGGAVDAETSLFPLGNTEQRATAQTEAAYDSAGDGWLGHLAVETPSPAGWWSVQGLSRSAGDINIPGLARRTDVPHGHSHGNSQLTEEPNPDGTLPNSYQQSQTGLVGWRYPGKKWQVSAGAVFYRNEYGVPFHSHADSTDSTTVDVNSAVIDMRQNRLLTEADVEWTEGLTSHLRFGYTDYAHDERDAGRIASQYGIDTHELRLETLLSLPDAPWRLAVGAQGKREIFRSSSATNRDGTVFPATESTDLAGFGVFSASWREWDFVAAGRIEHHELELIDFPGYGKGYTPQTYAASITRRLPAGWELGLHQTWLERAPTAEELFGNGGHVSSGLFERGSVFQFPSFYFETEKGQGTELELSWIHTRASVSLAGYYQEYDRYLFLQRSEYTDDPTGLPIFEHRQQPSTRKGFEVVARLFDPAFGLEGLSLEAGMDAVEATYKRLQDGDDGPLPRIPPLRYWLETTYRWADWKARVRWTHAEAQRDADLNSETATPAYDRLDLSLQRTWGLGRFEIIAAAALQNATNATIRHHTSFLKDVAPEAGRHLVLSLSAAY